MVFFDDWYFTIPDFRYIDMRYLHTMEMIRGMHTV